MERKLPVLATLLAAFELFRTHIAYAFKITAHWFLVLLVAPYYLAGSVDMNLTVAEANTFQPWELIHTIIYAIGWGSIAVLWHWRILRADNQSQKVLTFDRRVWFYIFRGMLICFIIVGIALLLIIPFVFALSSFSNEITGSIAFYPFIAGLLIIIGFIGARLSVALPAIALGVDEFGLSRAWTATTDNGFRLLIVTALPIIPLSLFSWGLAASEAGEMGLYAASTGAVLLNIVFQLFDFAFGLLGLTVLSLTYAFFAENKEAKAVRASS